MLILSYTYEYMRNVILWKTSLNNNIPETAAIEDDTHMKKYYDESSISNSKLILCQRQWREIEKGMSKYLQKSHNKAMKSYTDFSC